MAKPYFELKLAESRSEDASGIAHRFLNLAEDLYREIELTGLGQVPDIDTFTGTVRVIVTDKSLTSELRQIIKRQLHQHHFTDDVEVTRHR
ncbi:MAG: hypothetical protein AAF911_14740 [Planctomycetota bacterium]